jgi:hypothetical protein
LLARFAGHLLVARFSSKFINYKPGSRDSSSTSLPAIIVMDAPNQVTLTDILQVTFTHLTPSGSSIKIGNFDSFEQYLDVHRFITAGSVIAVPEPSAFGVMSAGLAVAGLLVSRRRQI